MFLTNFSRSLKLEALSRICVAYKKYLKLVIYEID